MGETHYEISQNAKVDDRIQCYILQCKFTQLLIFSQIFRFSYPKSSAKDNFVLFCITLFSSLQLVSEQMHSVIICNMYHLLRYSRLCNFTMIFHPEITNFKIPNAPWRTCATTTIKSVDTMAASFFSLSLSLVIYKSVGA